jgi:hypothetical protein
MAWRVFAASAIGKSHLDAGTPCQDAFARAVAGDLLVATVCDGAGSQPLSHVGSQALSRRVVERLLARFTAGEALPALTADAFAQAVGDVIAEVRAGLVSEAGAAGVGPESYASTLVGAVANGEGGWFFHVGDGQGVAQPRAETDAVVVSLPENGEYANETYFVSGRDWREHLRLTPIPMPLHAIVMMTDGAAPFVMAKGDAALYGPFIQPVERYLTTASEADGCAALAATLADPRTYLITGDDKTLLIALWE